MKSQFRQSSNLYLHHSLVFHKRNWSWLHQSNRAAAEGIKIRTIQKISELYGRRLIRTFYICNFKFKFLTCKFTHSRFTSTSTKGEREISLCSSFNSLDNLKYHFMLEIIGPLMHSFINTT